MPIRGSDFGFKDCSFGQVGNNALYLKKKYKNEQHLYLVAHNQTFTECMSYQYTNINILIFQI